MARTYSKMMELGRPAPPFLLPVANPEVDDRGEHERSIEDYADAAVLTVVFTCNHCPYARHVEDTLIEIAREYAETGVAFVAINSNDPDLYPDDSFEKMATRAREKNYPYPYLFDGTQEVAKSYGAVCTPDVFVFDRDRRLAYRGRVDESRPGMGESTGWDLRNALRELLESGTVTIEQYPSIGCNIKWRPGNEPAI